MSKFNWKDPFNSKKKAEDAKEAEAAQRRELLQQQAQDIKTKYSSQAVYSSAAAAVQRPILTNDNLAGIKYTSTGAAVFQNADDEQNVYNQLVSEKREVVGESVEATRRSVNKLAQAEELAAANLDKLATQGEQLKRTEQRLDEAAGHAKYSHDRSDALTRLNKSFLLPVGSIKPKFDPNSLDPMQKKAKADQRLLESEMHRSVAISQTTRLYKDEEPIVGDPYVPPRVKPTSYAKTTALRPAVAEMDDDSRESEISSNLDQVSNSVNRLKAMSLLMNEEITAQNQRIDRLGEKSDKVTTSVVTSAAKLDKIMGKK